MLLGVGELLWGVDATKIGGEPVELAGETGGSSLSGAAMRGRDAFIPAGSLARCIL